MNCRGVWGQSKDYALKMGKIIRVFVCWWKPSSQEHEGDIGEGGEDCWEMVPREEGRGWDPVNGAGMAWLLRGQPREGRTAMVRRQLGVWVDVGCGGVGGDQSGDSLLLLHSVSE